MNRLGWRGVDELNDALRGRDYAEVLAERRMGVLDRFDVRSAKPGSPVPFGYVGSRGYVDRALTDAVLRSDPSGMFEADYIGPMSKKDRLERSPGPYTADPEESR